MTNKSFALFKNFFGISDSNLKFLLIIFFGIINGLLLQLTWVTVNYWLGVNGVDLKKISIFALTSLPYSLKYILGPAIDYIAMLYSNRYKSYSYILHISLAIISLLVLCLSNLNVSADLLAIGVVCLGISLFSAIIDIVLNILRIEFTDTKEQGRKTSLYTIGYRIGMLVTSSGTIWVSNYIQWGEIFFSLALIILIINILVFLSPINLNNKLTHKKISQFNNHTIVHNINFFERIFIQPFLHLKRLSNFLYIISFLVLYKAADHMLIIMLQPMLIKLKYTAIEIATAGKSFGIACSVIGGVIAGKLINRLNIYTGLAVFALLHMTSFFFLFPLYHYGHNIIILYIFTAIQATTSGMTMVAYVAYISSLCHGNYKGTQYSIFYSLMGLSRALFPTSSGYIVTSYGWDLFFIILIIISISSVVIIKKIKHIK